MIERQSTNEIAYSNSFNSGDWDTSGIFGIVTANASVAPDGTTTAVRLYDDHSNAYNASQFFYQFTNDMQNDTEYTASIYVKSDTSNCVILSLAENVTSSRRVSFRMSTENILNMEYDSNGRPMMGFVKLPNNWYRLWVSYKSSNTPYQGLFSTNPNCGTNGELDPSQLGGVYFWGAQVEKSYRPTSYITTIGSIATRQADLLTTTAGNFGSWFDSSIGTLILDAEFTGLQDNVFDLMMMGDNGFPYQRISTAPRVYPSSPLPGFSLLQQADSTNKFDGFLDNVFKGGKATIGYTVNGTGAELFNSLQSSIIYSTNTGSSPVFTQMVLGNNFAGNSQFSGHIKSLKYWTNIISPEVMRSATIGK